MAALKFFFATLAACVAVSLAYSTGAPNAACGDLTPQHGPTKPQDSAIPYSVIVAESKVTKGQTIKVTVRGNGAEDKIKGFLIQARDGALPIGQFKVVDPNNSQLLTCKSAGDSITHKEIAAAVSEVTFEWVAPTDFDGNVAFVGTVALNGGAYWNNLRSASLRVV